MNALDVLENLTKTSISKNENLKYCLVDEKKRPYTIFGNYARPNCNEDFSSLEELLSADNLYTYKGVGISINASNVCAIDVDHCFSNAFDFESIDSRGKDIFNTFKDLAYIEFSFSGTGMRVIFLQEAIENYSDIYYVKNSKNQIEYYQPSGSARYVTITGQVLANNPIISQQNFKHILIKFLDKYMKRPISIVNNNDNLDNTDDLETAKKKLKRYIFKNMRFQDLWYGKAPGSGKNESELDFAILQQIYLNITTNKETIRLLFETSPYFKSKDHKHINKWEYNNHRYYNYVYDRLGG